MTAIMEREAGRAVRFCLVGAANSFHLNRRWTFSDIPTARWARTRFVAIQGLGALTSAVGLGALQSDGWAHMTAECAVLPCVTAGLYGHSRMLVFRQAAATPPALPDTRLAAP